MNDTWYTTEQLWPAEHHLAMNPSVDSRYYSGSRSDKSSWVFQEPHMDYLLTTITLLILSFLSTLHYRKSPFGPQNIKAHVVHHIPMVPYWIPYLGHIVPFSVDSDALLKSIRAKFSFDLFALKLAGSRHYMVYDSFLVAKVLNKREKDVAYAKVQCDMLGSFGLQSKWKHEFGKHLPQFQKAVIAGLMREPALTNVVRNTVHYMEALLANLVTVSAQSCNPQPWEKWINKQLPTAGKGSDFAEVDLFPLVRDAMGHCANPAIMGKQFLKDYPNILDDLWVFDDSFLPLVSGVPSWAPIPSLRRSVKARDRIIQNLLAWADDYRRSLLKDIPGKDFSDVSEVMRQVITMLDATTIDREGGGSVILIVFWALNANANNLVFWLLSRVAADADLLSSIRSEIQPYVQTLRSKSTVDTEVQISVEGLMNSCPLLKATYFECNRVHSRPISFRTIANDVIVTDDKNRKTGSSTSYLLQKNSYLYVPHFLHHIAPENFPDPDNFKPERFLAVNPADPDGEPIVDTKTLRPYGGGASICKGRYFAEREVLVFAAGFLALWDVEDVKGGKVRVPGNVKASATSKPDNNCRVRIRRRAVV